MRVANSSQPRIGCKEVYCQCWRQALESETQVCAIGKDMDLPDAVSRRNEFPTSQTPKPHNETLSSVTSLERGTSDERLVLLAETLLDLSHSLFARARSFRNSSSISLSSSSSSFACVSSSSSWYTSGLNCRWMVRSARGLWLRMQGVPLSDPKTPYCSSLILPYQSFEKRHHEQGCRETSNSALLPNNLRIAATEDHPNANASYL